MSPMAGIRIHVSPLRFVIVSIRQDRRLRLYRIGAYRTLCQIREDIAAVRKATPAPFGVNSIRPSSPRFQEVKDLMSTTVLA